MAEEENKPVSKQEIGKKLEVQLQSREDRSKLVHQSLYFLFYFMKCFRYHQGGGSCWEI
jgi:hypothetical protein